MLVTLLGQLASYFSHSSDLLDAAWIKVPTNRMIPQDMVWMKGMIDCIPVSKISDYFWQSSFPHAHIFIRFWWWLHFASLMYHKVSMIQDKVSMIPNKVWMIQDKVSMIPNKASMIQDKVWMIPIKNQWYKVKYQWYRIKHQWYRIF